MFSMFDSGDYYCIYHRTYLTVCISLIKKHDSTIRYGLLLNLSVAENIIVSPKIKNKI